MIALRWFTILMLVSIYVECSDLSPSQWSCLEDAECQEQERSKYDKAVICYFTDWAWYRSSPANFRPENINASLCTHILYAFTILDNVSLTMVPSDTWADIDNNFFESVVAFKEQGVEVMASVGGWTNSVAGAWSNMMSTSSSRKIFIDSVMDFLEEYGFDGLDVDYEYPACPQGDTSAALADDKSNFNSLMSELKERFGTNYSLSLATAAGKTKITDCYDMVSLIDIVDWINVMTYEYHSYADGVTGSLAPLCGTSDEWGVHETMLYYLDTLGCPPEKLVMGIPFYGASYTLATGSVPEFGEVVTGAGNAGPYTASAGTISYMEICKYIKDGNYSCGYDKLNNEFAWANDQFISFDGIATIEKKACFIKKWGLKGAMFWTLDYDDFNDICGCGSYPLLNTLNYHLGRTDTCITCY